MNKQQKFQVGDQVLILGYGTEGSGTIIERVLRSFGWVYLIQFNAPGMMTTWYDERAVHLVASEQQIENARRRLQQLSTIATPKQPYAKLGRLS